MSRSPVLKKIRKLLMGQVRNVVPQRFTMGNTCLGWSRILKLIMEKGKEEEVKRQKGGKECKEECRE
jgi:hypothetical protein